MEYVLVVTALATASVSGVLFAFSDFIMGSFARIDADAGRKAMQSINDRVYRSAFLMTAGLLLPLSLGLGWHGMVTDQPWIVAGAASYALGVVGVTVFGNVPMNKRLDHGAAAAPYWPVYQRDWTRLNHVRSAFGLFAATSYLMAVV